MKIRLSDKEKMFWWCAGGVLFTAILGTVLHFLYEWTGESGVVKPISAIDESTFQHMKIMYFPMLIFGVIQWCFLRHEKPCFWLVKLVGIMVALTLIPTLFYTYNGAFGRSPDWLNITIFMVSAIGGYGVEYLLFERKREGNKWSNLAFLGVVALGVLFVVFTYLPPDVPLFKSPV